MSLISTESPLSRRRVVVTGLGAISPIGNTVPEAWENLLAGKSGIGPITRFDASAFSSRIAGEVKNFDSLRVIDGRRLIKAPGTRWIEVEAYTFPDNK